ncbi:MAG: hypothetical protein HY298_26180 [Verrucomicrobia bacterium]|nr:hypothetical protein [Verrucomicrobiota bacterium]
MARQFTIGIVSDIHYAGAAEKARGNDFEFLGVTNPLQRLVARAYRHFIWLRYPMGHNHLLDEFLKRMDSPDYVIANGDYSCNSAFVGVSDDAACLSARECLEKLRNKFGENFQASFGDHELGKLSFMGGQGGMRLASWHRAQKELGLQPFWRVELGNYVLMGVASSLVALPVYEPDTLAMELAEWKELRAQHLEEIRRAFAHLKPDQRVLLFCHDPTALPFLWQDESVRSKLPQVEQTIIGHLHTNLIFWKSRLLAGMPMIPFLGHTTRRLTAALHEARHWRPFNVRLCPSLAGIELLKDGGYYTAGLDADAQQPARFHFHRLAR